MNEQWHHTTVVAVRRDGRVAIGSDGQVTLGNTVMKQTAAKVRTLAGGKVLAGFAGSVADALALFSRFEAKLEAFGHNLERAAVELAREWRTDRALRHLERVVAEHPEISGEIPDIFERLRSSQEAVAKIQSTVAALVRKAKERASDDPDQSLPRIH